ncbi:uncharacterized protein EAF02_001774 [Botrytis sinoallii]|uniref:uncharacterized protein n=1 Tax=Botrytis sinoallii TaxID=1463999 RepID=UPI0018FF760A|nr:uncharacterized protein EAF02_001774 [Botrytis sinoallii]KAF7891449.1 hypothetical protein EAF02_001774 [Botrytis sinoallii]
MGFSNRDHLFTSTSGMNGATLDGYSYARDAIDLPTVTTTVTAGVVVGDILDEEQEKKIEGSGMEMEMERRGSGNRKWRLRLRGIM